MTTTESTTTPIAGIAGEDPVRVAEALRDEFRIGAADRDRERKFPYEQCAAFRASGLLPRKLWTPAGSTASAVAAMTASTSQV